VTNCHRLEIENANGNMQMTNGTSPSVCKKGWGHIALTHGMLVAGL